MVQEFIRCKNDPVYFIETYMRIVHVDFGLIPFKLRDFQREMLIHMVNERRCAFCLARQSGKSIIVCGFLLWYIIFHEHKEIGLLANEGDTAMEILGRIQLAYQHLPMWLQHGVVEFNKGSFVLENGSSILAAATSSDNVRGHTFAIVYLDECVGENTYITIKNKETNEIEMLTVKELKERLINDFFKIKYIKNTKYEVLTKEGFKEFSGIKIKKAKTLSIYFDSKEFVCTPDHLILKDNVFVKANTLQIGDVIENKTITSITYNDKIDRQESALHH